MKERKFSTIFKKWLIRNDIPTGSFELKVCRGKSIPFDKVKDHQMDALRMTYDSFAHKIPDDSASYKPFDIFNLNNEKGFVVIYFVESKKFYVIEHKNFEKEIERSDRKSLTEGRADYLADFTDNLN